MTKASKGSAGGTRLIGRLPKIGIRPTIDGRLDGVRESLEAQTQNLAKSVAKLISGKLRHPSGEKVQCVIPSRCIGGVAEAAECADLFEREGVGVSLTVTPCWCYGAETMDMDPHRPKAIFGFNGTERPGAVYLAAALAGHNQKGLPCFSIYGEDVQDAGDGKIPQDVAEKILRFARAGLAVATMRGKSYLSMGGVSMGIAGCIVDHGFFEKHLGMRVETVDMSEFARRIEAGIFDAAEFKRAMAWVRKNCPEGKDYNPSGKKRSRKALDAEWEYSVKMALVARDLMVGNRALEKLGRGEEAQGHNAIAAGFQGQRQWTDGRPNGDFMEAILNTSFDWGGIRQPYILATENDSLNAVAMLFGHLLQYGAQVFADVRTYWSPDAYRRVTGDDPPAGAEGGFLHLINSGPAALDATGRQTVGGKPAIKPYWEVKDEEVAACLEATTWHPSMTEYFPGGGWSTRFLTRGGMPATIARVNLLDGFGPVLQVAEGETIELAPDAHRVIDERTNPTWPTTYFVPRTGPGGAFRDAYNVMANWGSNHCSMCYGHVAADMITLAAMLRIPVMMHNAPAESIFRPHMWGLFGTSEPEAADYRACSTLGPLYG